MRAKKEAVVGGYVHIEIAGQMHRVYYETAGAGQPLLCLHTAGSDSRQYRELLNSEALTANHQVICFDMPYHGKSSPPAGWEKHEYRLTSDLYVQTILSFMDAMEIHNPIALGCSIGGRVVLHLALKHPERFKALIGLQSGAHVNPYYELDWLHRPDVNGGEVCAGIVSGLIGPNADSQDRWETLWHYMQGGPGIFKGDLHFYKSEGDLRGMVQKIDTGKCPLHLLTGEYDYSCTPEDSQDLARLIPGSHFEIMPGIGHFPMSEAPHAFMNHLLPVLQRIQSGQHK
ncbi:MAG: alpha/beta hydrolase [Hydrogenophaga sp.]|uniref:alpha/beta fold hydrolase n=1 Tax=Hydrogenophaga sp. TaxID=1904254 RepID=UPI0027254B32|nr:alpha/beta hydrolase [Hydrogenophaga sp.]MDO9031623.1 alpha/beta hydrolase [Hydrogenophaga sp.]